MSSLKRRLGTTVPLLLGTCALVGAVAACGDDDDAQPKPDMKSLTINPNFE